jgi:hypothetical protein
VLRFFSLTLVVAAIAISGCDSGHKPLEITEVSGTVNLDGKPLPEGEVMLVNSAGEPPDVLPVINGEFSGPARMGPMRVEIRAYRPGKTPTTPIPAESQVGPENYLPARFNSTTTLTAEVTDGGLKPARFDVQSK